MECIILAGGLGTRLKKTVPDLPKPLAPVNDQPFLALLLKQLAAFKKPKISKVILAVGYKAEAVQACFQKKFYPFELLFSRESLPLGTGGALKKALSLCTQETVLALNGDSYLAFDPEKLFLAHSEKQADITLAYTEITEASRYGRLVLDPAERILSFQEKPSQNTVLKPANGKINGGVYLIQKQILEQLPFKENQAFSLEKEAFPIFLKKRFFACFASGIFIDIGTPESYLKAQQILKGI
ncbi:MAG: sugar phosphate nucleotidyltransferase [Parachlamydiales bacterium]|jgi:D-glycero-alpha-D-manno-heptose 1-phosphate guanylyltransferase